MKADLSIQARLMRRLLGEPQHLATDIHRDDPAALLCHMDREATPSGTHVEHVLGRINLQVVVEDCQLGVVVKGEWTLIGGPPPLHGARVREIIRYGLWIQFIDHQPRPLRRETTNRRVSAMVRITIILLDPNFWS